VSTSANVDELIEGVSGSSKLVDDLIVWRGHCGAVTDADIDEIGPIDYLVVEFPSGHQNFSGEMARELVALVEAVTDPTSSHSPGRRRRDARQNRESLDHSSGNWSMSLTSV
jgi:hypothetical protein